MRAGAGASRALLTRQASIAASSAIQNVGLQIDAAAIADVLACIASQHTDPACAQFAAGTSIPTCAAVGRIDCGIYAGIAAEHRLRPLRTGTTSSDALLVASASDGTLAAIGVVRK